MYGFQKWKSCNLVYMVLCKVNEIMTGECLHLIYKAPISIAKDSKMKLKKKSH